MGKQNYEEYLKEQFRSKVWNALEDVATEFPEIQDDLHKKNMREAVEYFMTHFYNLTGGGAE